jgi:O-antigen ligase
MLRVIIAAVLGLLLSLGVLLNDWLKLPMMIVLGYYAAVLGALASLVIGNWQRWLLAITIVDMSIQLDAYLGWNWDLASLGSTSGFNVSLTTASLVVLYTLWLVELLTHRRPPKQRPSLRAAGALPFYVAAVGLSMIFAVNPRAALYELWIQIQLLLVFIYVAGAVRKREDIIFLLSVAGVMVGVQGAIVFVQKYFGLLLLQGTDPLRPGGTFISPNVVGSYLATMLLVMASFLIAKRISIRSKLLVIPFLLVGLVGLIISQSRGAWLSIAIAASLFVMVAWQRRWLSTRTVAAISVAVMIVGAAMLPLITVRLTKDDGGAAEARGPLNEIALSMFQDHPVTGIGANNFASLLPQYLTPYFSSEWIFTVHNKYLLTLSETGILGLASFVAFLIMTLARAFVVFRAGDRQLSVIALGILCAFIGVYIHFAVDIFKNRGLLQMLWTLSALLFAMNTIMREERAARRSLKTN